MKTVILGVVVALCASLSGCVVIPERHYWWHGPRGAADVEVPRHRVG